MWGLEGFTCAKQYNVLGIGGRSSSKYVRYKSAIAGRFLLYCMFLHDTPAAVVHSIQGLATMRVSKTGPNGDSFLSDGTGLVGDYHASISDFA